MAYRIGPLSAHQQKRHSNGVSHVGRYVIWASTRQKPVLFFFDKARLKPVSLSTNTCWKIKISLVASLDTYMILSKTRITKALISMRGGGGWSTPLLFVNSEDMFSGVEAHVYLVGCLYERRHIIGALADIAVSDAPVHLDMHGSCLP